MKWKCRQRQSDPDRGQAMDLSPESNGKLLKDSIKFKAGGWVGRCDMIKSYLKLTGLSEYGAD